MPLAIPFLFIVLAIGGMAVVSLSQPFGSALTGWLKSLGLFGTVLVGPVAKLTLGLASWISNRVGAAILDATSHVVGWFGALYAIIAHVFTSALMWPIEMLRFQEWLLTRGIPRIVRSLTHGSTTILTVGAKRLDALQRAIVAAERFVLGRIRPIAHAAVAGYLAPYLTFLYWLRHHVHALTAVLPHALPVPFGRTIAQIKKRLRALEREKWGTKAFAVAVAVALTRLGISWIRCNNVRRVGRSLCGLSPRAITDLLGLLADWVILTNICRVFTLLQEGLGVIQPQVTAFITATETWACYGDHEKPPRLTPPKLDLPDTTGISGLPV